MGLDINLNTSKIDISEEDGLDIDLYEENIDISNDEADDIVIEITGLKSISKFIGLEDTPLYYDNCKFFKVEDNKIVYTDIQWKDISGDITESPEIIAVISDLVNEIASYIVDENINLHNLNEEAHPHIQDIIQENYNTLDTKIDDTKNALDSDIEEINRKMVDTIQGDELIDVSRENNTVSLNSKSFIFEQGIPATEWVINHNLNKRPSVMLTNSNGQRFYAFWEYPSNNQVIVKLDSATTGFAYLN